MVCKVCGLHKTMYCATPYVNDLPKISLVYQAAVTHSEYTDPVIASAYTEPLLWA
jgi:hypothetical protein